MPAQLVAEATAYAKRNVFQTLSALAQAGVVRTVTVANERRFSMDRDVWADALAVDVLPRHREWPQLLRAAARLSRFVENRRLDKLTEYMLASAARDVMAGVEEDLIYAGVPVVRGHHHGEEYWSAFGETVRLTLNVLNTGHP